MLTFTCIIVNICQRHLFYLLKVNNRIIKTMCEVYSKWTIKTLERLHWHRWSVGRFWTCMLNTFLYHYLVTMISLIYCKSHCLYLVTVTVTVTVFIYPYFGLRLDPSKIFWNALVIVIPFLSFKGIIHAYLL